MAGMGNSGLVSLNRDQGQDSGCGQLFINAVNGNMRGDLDLAGYISQGAEDWCWTSASGLCAAKLAPERRTASPGNPDKDLDEKAARKTAKYRELYRDHRRHRVCALGHAADSCARLQRCGESTY